MLTILSKDKAGLSEPGGGCGVPVTHVDSLAFSPGGELESGVWGAQGAPAKMPETPHFALAS